MDHLVLIRVFLYTLEVGQLCYEVDRSLHEVDCVSLNKLRSMILMIDMRLTV